jgi:hypothetical protein
MMLLAVLPVRLRRVVPVALASRFSRLLPRVRVVAWARPARVPRSCRVSVPAPVVSVMLSSRAAVAVLPLPDWIRSTM